MASCKDMTILNAIFGFVKTSVWCQIKCWRNLFSVGGTRFVAHGLSFTRCNVPFYSSQVLKKVMKKPVASKPLTAGNLDKKNAMETPMSKAEKALRIARGGESCVRY